MAEEKAVVRFLKQHKAYNPGERAGFPLAEAKRMIGLGAVVLDDDTVTMANLGLTGKAEVEADAVDTATHELTVEQCVKHIKSIDDLEALQALWEGEMEHPNHDGGRRGVLNVIRARAEELKPDETEEE